MPQSASPEIMRHVPTPRFLADKIDGDVRRALDLFTEEGPRFAGPAAELGKGLHRLARLLRVDGTLTSRQLIDSIVAKLRDLDENQFRRRRSEDEFVRGLGERVWTASTALYATVENLLDVASREKGELVLRYRAPLLPNLPDPIEVDAAR